LGASLLLKEKGEVLTLWKGDLKEATAPKFTSEGCKEEIVQSTSTEDLGTNHKKTSGRDSTSLARSVTFFKTSAAAARRLNNR